MRSITYKKTLKDRYINSNVIGDAKTVLSASLYEYNLLSFRTDKFKKGVEKQIIPDINDLSFNLLYA